MSMNDAADAAYALEPCDRRWAASVSALCAGAPAYQYALDLGGSALIRTVEADRVLARRLLTLTLPLAPPDVPVPDVVFERLLVHVVEDAQDLGCRELAIFGSGVDGRFFADLVRLAGARVACFVDNDALRLRRVDGIDIITPAAACASPGPPIVIASRRHECAMASQLATLLDGCDRLVLRPVNSWRARLAGDPALCAADAACRDLVREFIEAGAAWATAFVLCNYRRFVHQWTEPMASGSRVASPSPFVYQMQ
ncbi:MAG TPA: hypothetical protein VGK32_24045 [Vicinamibacterales bacterium]|jgi:hypothetical protein